MRKKDIKYIIKRIIIGVGIVFCVGFLNKCSVKADELTSIHTDIFGYQCPSHDSNLIYYTNSYSFDIGSYNVEVRTSSEANNNLVDYLLMVFRNNDSYILFTNNGFNPTVINNQVVRLDIDHINITSTDTLLYDSSGNLLDTYFPLPFSNILTYSTSNVDFDSIFEDYDFENYNCSSIPNLYTGSYNQGNGYPPGENTYDVIGYLLENYTLVYTNVSVLYDNTPLVPDTSPIIPDYYSSINMQEHEGVYFVPKNYSTIPTIQNSIGENVIPFNYYYKGNFADGYFPLNDYSKIVFTLNNVISREQFLLSENWFPYQQIIDSTTYDYYAYIIQNNDINSFSQHLDSIIYYDSRYFDYYFIDDFSSYSQTISIIDKNNTSSQIDVSIKDSLKQLYRQGQQNNGTNNYIGNQMAHALDNNVLGQYLEFITIPFNFLRSFTSATCSPINIPIPFVGGNITLPCISSVLSENVPQLYNIIVIVVNGFLVYRITMRNIDTCTDVVKADDDKIEVIDL